MVTRVFLPTLVGSFLLPLPLFQVDPRQRAIYMGVQDGWPPALSFYFHSGLSFFACLKGSDAFYNFVFQSLCLTLLLAGFADMCVSCRFPILWSRFPPSASSSPCGSAEA